MSEVGVLKLKVCLIGENEVGKTSLIRRFVFDQFSDKYISTIGTKITKKKIKIKHPKTNKPEYVALLIWDIMGQKGVRHLLQESYFKGADGVLGVCDVTRKRTLSELTNWMTYLDGVGNGFPVVFLGNKCDLERDQEVHREDIDKFKSQFDGSAVFLSSAKTGMNVELAFKTLTENMLSEIYKKRVKTRNNTVQI
ncbi:MAG: GTP-binding protein [Thermoplasmata archaeon]|nr:MAG: GTP-binding protein [Thermoplasmata archaeon]